MAEFEERQDRVFAMLERAAVGGLECPTNQQIARLVGARSIASAARIVAALEKARRIKVIRLQNYRVVEIVATGKRTMAQGLVNRWAVPKDSQVDKVADHMAEGATFAECARTMGVTLDYVHRAWRHILKGLGPQAV